jgi:serine/threonine protein kinase/tetratricopeptide (TPR) repeat protein
MDPGRWAIVKSLFEAANARAEPDRTAFLREASAGDASLYGEVASLLAADAGVRGRSSDWTSRLSSAIESHLAPAGTLLGRTIDHYRIAALIGQGGMGLVYRAYDLRLERPVAVKVVNTPTLDASGRAALMREARYASSLNHPHICTVYDIGELDGEPYIAMEWVEGRRLDTVIADGKLPLDTALRYALQVSDALAHAHERGIAHHDLKTANVLITHDNRVKLLDFGVARRLNSGDLEWPPHEDAAEVRGTFGYMAPEVLRRQDPDQRSDIWAFGILLHELLAGDLPFTGTTTMAMSAAILTDAPVPLPQAVPPLVRSIVTRCLMKDRLERYQHARSVRSDIAAAIQALHVGEDAGETGGVTLRAVSAQQTRSQQSIAVLYFDNLSATDDQEYLRDGVTEDIITELGRIGGVRVFPRSAVTQYRDKSVTSSEIGRDLNADYVLTGSIRRAGRQVRITVQLVETATGYSLWTERYDRELGSVIELQDEIARAIARQLRITLPQPREGAMDRRRVANADAYDLYLQGRRLLRRGCKKDVRGATELFERAVEIDPRFALGYAGIGYAYGRIHRYHDQSKESLEKGVGACRHALDLEPELAEALSARAFLYYAHEEYELSIQYSQMALDRKDDCDGAYWSLGASLHMLDRLSAGSLLVDRAIERSGDDFNVYLPYRSILMRLGEYDRALRLKKRLRRTLEWHVEWAPDNARARILLACAHAEFDERASAVHEIEKAVELEPHDASNLLNAACAYGLLGSKSEALGMLRLALENGYWHLDMIARDPDLRILHGEPEFQRLIRNAR